MSPLRKVKSAAPKAEAPAPLPGPADPLIERHGDMLYDLCESILWGSSAAQTVVRSIFRELRAERKFNLYAQHERAWVLRVACQRLRDLARDHVRRLTANEQLELDSTEKASGRLKQFDSYFHRLPVNDQIVLLLRDKYGLPYPEIATALSIPEGSIKIRRQQALRALEDWIWEE